MTRYPRFGELAAAARAYTARGWQALPGAAWSPHHQGYRCGRRACHQWAPHPIDTATAGQCRPLTGRDLTAELPGMQYAWERRSFNVLLATGTITVVVGPALLITAVDEQLQEAGHPAPIAAHPDGTRHLLTGPFPVSDALRSTAGAARVQIHGRSSWVFLPPSVMRLGPVTWHRAPEACGWQLPPGPAVRDALQSALHESDPAQV